MREAREDGYDFSGVWLSKWSMPEEIETFKRRRKELKKEGYKVLTLAMDNGKALFKKKIQ